MSTPADALNRAYVEQLSLSELAELLVETNGEITIERLVHRVGYVATLWQPDSTLRANGLTSWAALLALLTLAEACGAWGVCCGEYETGSGQHGDECERGKAQEVVHEP